MKNFVIFLFMIFLAESGYCQTACPVGVVPGSPQCGPDSGTSRGDAAPPRPTGEWIRTWGAIVGAGSSSQAWASIGKLSKKDAEADALDQCESAGVKDCSVEFTYRNQCVAVASASSANTKTGIGGAPEISTAKNNALHICEKNGGSDCSVIYSDCTKPIFKKY
ncbi:DUF4189 domain-containing protein [Xanthomonas vasicola]|uniref:DUF4189 domain-containing protein n=1 Tax=Xanthomonas vasicola TaxID=56459 RepID=A0ABD7S5Q3_XANVA|nr:DUF4189 domain-containing protein [Xanthomonas vasicola]TWQ48723.1 DUF4189 domain-containing protein [Xanthomonas vasicola]